MLELTCRGCGRTGRVSARLAGQLAFCTRCGTGNTAPLSDALKIDVADWSAAIDLATESVAVEYDERLMAVWAV